MTTEEIKKDDSTSVLSPEVEALLKATAANTESIANLTKGQEAILEALKKTDANPVDHGAEVSQKPKVSDSTDVGDKAKTEQPSYAPDGDAQGGNSGSSTDSGSDGTSDAGTGSVKKSDDPKEDKEKEEKEKEKGEKIEDTPMKKSVSPDGIEYAQIAKSRPLHKAIPDTPEGAPTGSQILDQINKGWGGKYTSYEQSFIEALNRLEKGEFGSGNPGGSF